MFGFQDFGRGCSDECGSSGFGSEGAVPFILFKATAEI